MLLFPLAKLSIPFFKKRKKEKKKLSAPNPNVQLDSDLPWDISDLVVIMSRFQNSFRVELDTGTFINKLELMVSDEAINMWTIRDLDLAIVDEKSADDCYIC